MKSEGGKWPDNFRRRIDPKTKLQNNIKELVSAPEGSEVEVLDVGAGPLTNLGCCWDGVNLHITAVDPLADEYDKLLKKHKIEPPVRTIRCDAEKLSSKFAVNSFDLVYAKNCIDHSYDPVTAIEQMLSVVRTGGCIYLQHNLNEAENEGYVGLHQWNFFERGGCFCIGNLQEESNVTKKLEENADVICKVRDDDSIIVKIYKK